MTITVGDKVPFTTFLKLGADGIEQINGEALFSGRKVVIFGLPGAFTPTCDSAHVPSFMRVADDLRAKGVDELVCVAVNDPWVMGAWGHSTGGVAAGITFLSDPQSEFAEGIDMILDVPATGFVRRMKRFSMIVEDGTVTAFNPEIARGVCEVSGGETLLAQL
ncbi:MAG: peroxiredoxin [Paracoccaceae bacterium]|nr:peroxiredoxin [Paracoccaceae bacterium]MDP7186406.1 peroxiredoxin [Paracoccaceae bacterium]